MYFFVYEALHSIVNKIQENFCSLIKQLRSSGENRLWHIIKGNVSSLNVSPRFFCLCKTTFDVVRLFSDSASLVELQILTIHTFSSLSPVVIKFNHQLTTLELYILFSYYVISLVPEHKFAHRLKRRCCLLQDGVILQIIQELFGS